MSKRANPFDNIGKKKGKKSSKTVKDAKSKENKPKVTKKKETKAKKTGKSITKKRTTTKSPVKKETKTKKQVKQEPDIDKEVEKIKQKAISELNESNKLEDHLLSPMVQTYEPNIDYTKIQSMYDELNNNLSKLIEAKTDGIRLAIDSIKESKIIQSAPQSDVKVVEVEKPLETNSEVIDFLAGHIKIHTAARYKRGGKCSLCYLYRRVIIENRDTSVVTYTLDLVRTMRKAKKSN